MTEGDEALEGFGPASDAELADLEMNPVGGIAAVASSVEFGLLMCLWRLAGISDAGIAFALFGGQHFNPCHRLATRLLKELRKRNPEDLDAEWDDVLKAAKKAMNQRGQLMHANWVGSRAQGGREAGPPGFQPRRNLHTDPNPKIVTAARLMALRTELERVAIALSDLAARVAAES